MRYELHSNIPLKEEKYMLISNHTSMMDVNLMLLLHKNHPLTFVGKKIWKDFHYLEQFINVFVYW